MAKIKPTKINKILITHWHGDHVLGLPGLIQTLGVLEYNKTLRIYGPIGTKKRIKALFQVYESKQDIKMEVKEIKQGVFYDGKDYSLEAHEIKHGIRTLGFRFIEKNKRHINLTAIKKLKIPEGPLLGRLQEGKTITHKNKKISPKHTTYLTTGKKIAYIPDSVPCKNTLRIAQDVDLLICDATYSSKLKEKAEKYLHMTARQAAEIANQANVKQLILTHFSARYKTTHELVEDAKDIFNNVIAAKDFMKVTL